MSIHRSANIAVECAGESCRICRLIDPESPIYSEHYRRLFFPAEFPESETPPASPPPPAPPSAPGIIRKAANLGKAVVTHAVAGFPQADDATVASRLATCRGCEFSTPAPLTCLRCGCHMEIKARWTEQVCPVGKW